MAIREAGDRTLPTFISLLVVGLLLMTFDVRLEGGGVVASLRNGTQSLLSPVQRAAAFIVSPVADIVETLGALASLREENQALRGQLASTQAELAGIQGKLARLEILESLYGLRLDELEVGRTPANVIGRPDGFDLAFIIDKGTSDGIALGQPVIDSFGYVVGTIVDVTGGSAIVVPIMASRNGVAVVVGVQVGNLVSQPGTNDMALDIFEAREPVIEGDEVRTSALSGVFPAGLPVGQVLRSAAPESASLTTVVRPYVQPEHLQVVVVLAWPPTPAVATTTTTLPDETTTIPDEETTIPDDGGE